MVDGATGDLVALDLSDADPWNSPAWRVPGQKNLVSLTWSADYSYMMAVYKDPLALAIWDADVKA